MTRGVYVMHYKQPWSSCMSGHIPHTQTEREERTEKVRNIQGDGRYDGASSSAEEVTQRSFMNLS